MAEPGRRRRVRTDPAPGSDPTPQQWSQPVRASEDADDGDGASANDDRLRADKPPHY